MIKYYYYYTYQHAYNGSLSSGSGIFEIRLWIPYFDFLQLKMHLCEKHGFELEYITITFYKRANRLEYKNYSKIIGKTYQELDREKLMTLVKAW